ncbi:hypothetical protein B0T20DRAFT_471505 [Sordaria brevicollis]|uniref:Uncharacterized protein n=1 Tax=Sordaria brevicollis TaxID=83679 RepID=A0AAE0PB82_SORBR|nr:hypothetical protein B0T20DRAFT_471505 [Sordaria brevicollis]
MSVTDEQPQSAPAQSTKLKDTTKESSEQQQGEVDNNIDVKKDSKPTADIHKNSQNNNRGRGVPRIVMAYIPASTPASPTPSHSTPPPGNNTPVEKVHGQHNPTTIDLTTKLNQAFDEYRVREERVGDLGQEHQDEGHEGDANSPVEQHQACFESEHHQVPHHQYPPEYQQQQYYPGHSVSPPNNAQWTYGPYHSASGNPPVYLQPPLQPVFQQQPHSLFPSPSPLCPIPPSFQISDGHNTVPSFSPYPYPPIPPQHFPPQPFPHPQPQFFPHPPPPFPHSFPPPPPPPQHPRHILDLLRQLEFIKSQLDGLDATHAIEIMRGGVYNFHRKRAKDLRKIKREKVEEMVVVVRELRGLGVVVPGRGQGPAMGYGMGMGDGIHDEFEQHQGYGRQERHWDGYGYGREQQHQQWHRPTHDNGHGHDHSGEWSVAEPEVGNDSGCCCGDDSAHTDSSANNDGKTSMTLTGECGTTVDNGATHDSAPEVAFPSASASASPDSSEPIDGNVAMNKNENGTRSRTNSLPIDTNTTEKPTTPEQVQAHEQPSTANETENENDTNSQSKDENNASTHERTNSWSAAEAAISEELRGLWNEKMALREKQLWAQLKQWDSEE